VHWLGTGLSTGGGVELLCDRAERVLLWGRNPRRAEQTLDRLGLVGRAEPRGLDEGALAEALRPGDVVVSMLPASHHLALLEAAVDAGAHFACSSYVSREILDTAVRAGTRGLVVQAEAGLDPGIDHLMAHSLVDQGAATVGDVATSAWFVSYCGGVPAVPNEFRYRFSWAPRGVLNALRSPARYIADGVERVSDRPWEATTEHALNDEAFEVYPNRDSIPYISQYHFPAGWKVDHFARGTLRLAGWRDAWSRVFEQLTTGDDASIAALADELAARYPTTAEDRDRVVLVVALRLRGADGTGWGGEFLLDMTGEESESAMARTVSVPLAVSIEDILSGQTSPGLHLAAEGDTATRWLARLRELGIDCRFRALTA
jgi:hypothetical protein